MRIIEIYVSCSYIEKLYSTDMLIILLLLKRNIHYRERKREREREREREIK